MNFNQLKGITSAKTELNLEVEYSSTVPGQIYSKSDIGTYQYTQERKAGPHAISGITDVNANYTPIDQDITYTSFGKVAVITQGDYRVEFNYGPDQARKTMGVYHQGGLKRKVYYFGNYERHVEGGNVTELYYIYAPSGLAAIYKKNNGAKGVMYYVHTDHLGSIHTITNEAKTPAVVARYYYNPWGEQRFVNKDNGDEFQSVNDLAWLHRGFTGHEHITEIGLINMNGRVYDPDLGMFISCDPQLQAPDNPINFNRYAYCLNNPLIYTDPSGELAWFVPVIIGAVVGFEAGGWISSGTPAFWKWEGEDWAAAGVGAMVGAAAGGLTAAAIGLAGGITGMTTQVNGTLVATKGWGIASSSLMNANLNMLMTGISSDWDMTSMVNSGTVGLASGVWTGTGGFGLAEGNLLEKTIFQNVGLAGRSIGNNWANDRGLFSSVNFGIGPLQFALGSDIDGVGESLLNINNVFQAVGLANVALDKNAKIGWDWKNLSPTYYDGKLYKALDANLGGTGAYVPVGSSATDKFMLSHEMRHVWQSRAMGNSFLFNYFSNFLYRTAAKNYYTNFYETLATGAYGYY